MITLSQILISRPEHQKSLFAKAVGKNGKTYYYNSNPMSVWVEDGEGMGGRTVTYEMLAGDTEYVKGPWNINADELLKQTGVDVTENFYSFGVVINRDDVEKFKDGQPVKFVLADKDWTKGKYDGAVERMRDLIADIGMENNSSAIIAFFNANGTLNFAGVK